MNLSRRTEADLGGTCPTHETCTHCRNLYAVHNMARHNMHCRRLTHDCYRMMPRQQLGKTFVCSVFCLRTRPLKPGAIHVPWLGIAAAVRLCRAPHLYAPRKRCLHAQLADITLVRKWYAALLP